MPLLLIVFENKQLLPKAFIFLSDNFIRCVDAPLVISSVSNLHRFISVFMTFCPLQSCLVSVHLVKWTHIAEICDELARKQSVNKCQDCSCRDGARIDYSLFISSINMFLFFINKSCNITIWWSKKIIKNTEKRDNVVIFEGKTRKWTASGKLYSKL